MPARHLIPLQRRLIGQAHALYTRLTAGLPHCFPAAAVEFAEALYRTPSLASDVFATGVAESGRFSGFVTGAVSQDSASARIARAGDGVITMLLAETGASARTLVQAATDWFRQRGAERVVAYDAGESANRWPFFNSGFAGCPEGLPITVGALAGSGFSICARELNLSRTLHGDWSGEIPDPATIVPDITLSWKNQSADNLDLAALRGERPLGSCLGHVVGAFQSAPEAARHGYIRWLGVDPDYQRRGIGRALLTAMLGRMQLMGLDEVSLTTGAHNWRARSLYESEGFVTVGSSVTLVREDLKGR